MVILALRVPCKLPPPLGLYYQYLFPMIPVLSERSFAKNPRANPACDAPAIHLLCACHAFTMLLLGTYYAITCYARTVHVGPLPGALEGGKWVHVQVGACASGCMHAFVRVCVCVYLCVLGRGCSSFDKGLVKVANLNFALACTLVNTAYSIYSLAGRKTYRATLQLLRSFINCFFVLLFLFLRL